MKPRIFVGSSKEGLAVAHALQSNLSRDAEVTVWDQGVFQLSITSLESLQRVLAQSDFAIFVFSPDDVSIVRGKKQKAARDNVIFELGMFVGQLGRERCFVLVPEKTPQLRIPTDLIGMTPATYEIDRSDHSLRAATAPACSEIRHALQLLKAREDTGGRQTTPDAVVNPLPTGIPATVQEGEEAKTVEQSWFDEFMANRNDRAIEILNKGVAESKTDEESSQAKAWIGFIQAKVNFNRGVQLLRDLIAQFPKQHFPYQVLCWVYQNRGQHANAISVLDDANAAGAKSIELVTTRVNVLTEIGQRDDAERLLEGHLTEFASEREVFAALADLYIHSDKNQDALRVLEAGLALHDGDHDLWKKYYNLLREDLDKTLALIPATRLLQLDAKSADYHVRLGNILLDLDFKNRAMEEYRSAEQVSQPSPPSWVLENIGNLMKNAGFSSEGVEYFRKSLLINSESEYAHERLAMAMKARDAERETIREKLAEARVRLTRSAALRRGDAAEAPKLPSP